MIAWYLNATLIFKGWLSSWECIMLLIVVWTDNSFLLFIFSLLIALVSAIWSYVLAWLYWIRFTINMQLKNIQLPGKINSYSFSSCLHFSSLNIGGSISISLYPSIPAEGGSSSPNTFTSLSLKTSCTSTELQFL